MRHEELEDNSIVVNKFSEESVRDFRKKVMAVAYTDPSMPVVVYIDSYGGNADAFNTMLSIMRSVPNTIITVCQGKAMSAGAALLAAGDVRFCDADARIMIHEASGGAMGSADDVKTDAKEFDRLNLQIMTFIANKCNKTYEQLKAIIRENEGRDLYLTPKQALELGIIDFIGLPQIRPVMTYTVELLPVKKKVQLAEQESVESILDKIITKKVSKKTKTDSKKKQRR